MARRLSVDDINTFRVNDHLSDSILELYYRMPTTKERAGFMAMAFTKKNGKIKNNYTEARVKYGADILKGVREGDFEVQKDGVYVPLSSDPKSENYDSAWKTKLKDMAPDILELLALRVFEASVAIADDQEPMVIDEEPEEDGDGETTDQD